MLPGKLGLCYLGSYFVTWEAGNKAAGGCTVTAGTGTVGGPGWCISRGRWYSRDDVPALHHSEAIKDEAGKSGMGRGSGSPWRRSRHSSGGVFVKDIKVLYKIGRHVVNWLQDVASFVVSETGRRLENTGSACSNLVVSLFEFVVSL